MRTEIQTSYPQSEAMCITYTGIATDEQVGEGVRSKRLEPAVLESLGGIGVCATEDCNATFIVTPGIETTTPSNCPLRTSETPRL